MPDAPAFDFYPERWLAATASMTDAEYRAYHQLLCHAWLGDGLPANEARLKALAGRKIPVEVMGKFKLSPDGRLRNPFMESVRQDQRKRILKSRRKIAKMNAARLGLPPPQDALQEPPIGPLVEGLEESLQDALVDPSCRPSSPLTTVSSTTAAGAPATLAEAQKFALDAMLSAQPETVESWFNSRCVVGWIVVKRGVEISIKDWRADLREFVKYWRFNDDERKAKSQPVNGAEHPPKPTGPKAKLPMPPNWKAAYQEYANRPYKSLYNPAEGEKPEADWKDLCESDIDLARDLVAIVNGRPKA